MGGEWPKHELGAHVDLLTGFAFKSNQFSEAGIRLVRGDNVKRGAFEWGETTRYWPEVTSELERYRLAEGDVLIGMDGSRVGENFARVRNIDLPALLVQRVARLRAKSSLDQDYLWFIVSNPRFTAYVKGTHTGTSIPHISGGQIKAFQFYLPSLSEQCAIANLLGVLDDKIELNRRMAETLEKQARATFTYWFVDFDPVLAKAEGRPTGLPADITALFPNRIGDNGLPEGWIQGTIEDLATVNPESWTNSTRPAQIRYVDLANTKWGRIETVQQFETSDAPSRAQRVLRIGDTIVGTVRPGNGAYARISADGLTGSTGFAVLRPRRQQNSAFVYLAATSTENIRSLASLADGGAYPAIRPAIVGKTPIAIPGKGVLDHFSKVATPLLEKIAEMDRENCTLAELRDTLHPKLISGELRLKDAEGVMGAVA